MSRALGATRDAPHRRTQKNALPMLQRRVAGNRLPDAFSLEAYTPAIFDQNPTRSCEGCCWGRAISTAFAAAGSALPWVPSQLSIYRLARQHERSAAFRSGKLPPLTDSGCMTADAAAAISLWGIRPMGPQPTDGRYSDCDETNVLEDEDTGKLEQDGLSIVAGEYRVDELAPNVVELVRASIVAGVPPVIAGFVGETYANWKPGSAPLGAPDMSDTSGGGHCTMLSQFAIMPSGEFEFWSDGSWGKDFGENGRVRVTEAWIRALWDIYPCAVATKAAA